MRLTLAYEQALAQGLTKDPAQETVVRLLQRVATALEHRESRRSIWTSIVQRLGFGLTQVRGVYLWGGVGRGKTFLMDLFFENLEVERKQRLHFHRFMQEVHDQLWKAKGRPDPIEFVAEEIADEAQVLCFDEFFVSDIGDAMILSELFAGLFSRNVVLIATSNIEPNRLYENGLQRRRFLPTIALLEQQTRVVEMGGSTDFRLQTLQRQALYRINAHVTPDVMSQDFKALARRDVYERVELTINKRTIRAEFCFEGIVAFRFSQLCDTPRNAADYIELARLFHSIVIYEIPQLCVETEDAARRFIALIDEFYDRNVNVIFNASVAVEELYKGERHRQEFERTRSRIREMLSDQYLSRPHRP